jgi:hypothetical protein
MFAIENVKAANNNETFRPVKATFHANGRASYHFFRAPAPMFAEFSPLTLLRIALLSFTAPLP